MESFEAQLQRVLQKHVQFVWFVWADTCIHLLYYVFGTPRRGLRLRWWYLEIRTIAWQLFRQYSPLTRHVLPHDQRLPVYFPSLLQNKAHGRYDSASMPRHLGILGHSVELHWRVLRSVPLPATQHAREILLHHRQHNLRVVTHVLQHDLCQLQHQLRNIHVRRLCFLPLWNHIHDRHHAQPFDLNCLRHIRPNPNGLTRHWVPSPVPNDLQRRAAPNLAPLSLPAQLHLVHRVQALDGGLARGQRQRVGGAHQDA